MIDVLKARIDYIPLCHGAVRSTRGEILAVIQISGGAQSAFPVNQTPRLAAGRGC